METYFEIGKTYQASYSLKEELVIGFENLFQDHHILHTDEHFAKSLGFQNKLVYGNILNGFISHFVGMELGQNNLFIASQQIDFHHPMYRNDQLNLTVTLVNNHVAVSTISFKFEFTNQLGLVVAKGKFLCKEIFPTNEKT